MSTAVWGGSKNIYRGTPVKEEVCRTKVAADFFDFNQIVTHFFYRCSIDGK
jgi:hypothetical protein